MTGLGRNLSVGAQILRPNGQMTPQTPSLAEPHARRIHE